MIYTFDTILKEVYCLLHWCISIIKEKTAHTFMLAFSSPFLWIIYCIVWSFSPIGVPQASDRVTSHPWPWGLIMILMLDLQHLLRGCLLVFIFLPFLCSPKFKTHYWFDFCLNLSKKTIFTVQMGMLNIKLLFNFTSTISRFLLLTNVSCSILDEQFWLLNFCRSVICLYTTKIFC